MTICSVKWCVAEAAPGSDACVVHRTHPTFAPEDLEAKIGHFETKAEWVEEDCANCDGMGDVEHDCDCEKCEIQTDECDVCDGDGKLDTCSICGFQVDWATTGSQRSKHEADCWQIAPKIIEARP